MGRFLYILNQFVILLIATLLASFCAAIGWHLIFEESYVSLSSLFFIAAKISLTGSLLASPGLLLLYFPISLRLWKKKSSVNAFAGFSMLFATINGFIICYFVVLEDSIDLYTPDLFVFYAVFGALTGLFHYLILYKTKDLRSVIAQGLFQARP